MAFDPEAISACIKGQREPEPFSGVVMLTQKDKVLFATAQGFAIRSESIPNRVDTRFQMASGCKAFTAVAVARLVEEGLLAFDTRLSDCVDVTFPNFDPGITIHHLLTHSSGITSYFEEDVNPDYESLWQERPMYTMRGPRDFLPLLQEKPMKFPPGRRFEYNDGGFILLGLVIECVTGSSFSTYVENQVLNRAGMEDSGYFAMDRLPERTAYAYIQDEDGTWRTSIYAVPIAGAPDGGAYTTAPDMTRFWKALFGGRLLSAEMTAQVLNPQIETAWDRPYSHYGYGVWMDHREDKNQRIFVEGADPGVALRSTVYPEEDLILTVIGNTEHALWPLYEALEKVLECND